MSPSQLLHSYIQAHNEGVRDGNFAPLMALFSPQCVVEFRNLPLTRLEGLPGLIRAFEEHPPSDELFLAGLDLPTPDRIVARYGWHQESPRIDGELHLTCDAGHIVHLVIARYPRPGRDAA